MHSDNAREGISRRRFLRIGGGALTGVVLLGAAGRALAQTNSLQAEFDSAAGEYGVPETLLLAMGYSNTLWEMPSPENSAYKRGDLESRGAYGVMHLEQNPWRDTLGRAASLTGIPKDRLKSDRSANIRGAAALLADIAGPNKPKNLDEWREEVAEYGDTDLYATTVFETLENGASRRISTGETLNLEAQNVEAPRIYEAQSRRTDYPRALWRPAAGGNYGNSSRERSYNIDKIVIHVAQGSYAGTVNYFQNPSAGVSAHYTVSRRGRIAQSVRHADIGYHAGHYPTNTRSIGIEHEGYVENSGSFTSAMYQASAKLSAYCCKRHRIRVDRRHIIGHHQVPGCSGPGGGASCHTDPGRYWDWDRYIRLVRRYRKRL